MFRSRLSLLLKREYSLKLNLLSHFISYAFVAVATIVFVPFYLRYIGVEAFGLVGFFTSLQAILSVMDLGLGVVINRELALRSGKAEKAQESRDLVRTLEVIYWLLAFLLGVGMLLLSPLLARWINPQNLSIETVENCFMIMSFGLALQFPLLLYFGGLFGLQKQVLMSVANVCFALLRGFGILAVLHFVSPAPESFFIAQAVLAALQVSVVGLLLWGALPKGNGLTPRFQKNFFGKIWRFSTGLSGISIMGILLTQIDKIILGRILPLETFGYYSLANVVSSGLTRLTTPIFQAYFPKLSQLAAQGEEKTLAQIYHQGSQVMGIVIFPIAALFIFFSPELMFLWQGNLETVQNTYLPVSLLMLGSALSAALYIPYALQLAFGWVKLYFYALTAAVIVLIPLTVVLALYYGVVGAASVWIILNAALIIVVIPLMHRRILPNQKWKWFREDLIVPLLAVLAAGAAGRYFFVPDVSQIAVLFQLILIFLLLFTTVCFASSYSRNWIINRARLLFT
jgi:O-antigen/teichoic acid export membrane protein